MFTQAVSHPVLVVQGCSGHPHRLAAGPGGLGDLHGAVFCRRCCEGRFTLFLQISPGDGLHADEGVEIKPIIGAQACPDAAILVPRTVALEMGVQGLQAAHLVGLQCCGFAKGQHVQISDQALKLRGLIAR